MHPFLPYLAMLVCESRCFFGGWCVYRTRLPQTGMLPTVIGVQQSVCNVQNREMKPLFEPFTRQVLYVC